MSPEEQARREIDRLLEAAGWIVVDLTQANIHASRGVAIRESPLAEGHYFAEYLLYVNGRAAGVVEAKKVGATLTGVEVQSGRYAQDLPPALPAWRRPLPFVYESTGAETHFTNGLDPEPRARSVFALHHSETLMQRLTQTAPDPPATVLTTDGHPPAAEAQRASAKAPLAEDAAAARYRMVQPSALAGAEDVRLLQRGPGDVVRPPHTRVNGPTHAKARPGSLPL